MAQPLLFLLVAAAAAAAALPSAVAQDMTDAEALMQLKKSFTNSSSLSSWLITSKDGDKSPCAPGSHEWHGVVCTRGTVTGLRLSGLHLGGTIDVDALVSFRRLRSVSLASNNFSGDLPGVDRLTALKSMFLSDNQFTGALPDDFFSKLNHLKKLWLDGNQLSGPIPASIAQATSLIELRLEHNAFSGELPPLPPPALKVFDISWNDLDGVVPEAFRKFDAGKFGSNQYLCYVPTSDRPCRRAPTEASSSRRLTTVFAALLVSAVVLALALCLCCNRRSRVRDYDSIHRSGSGSGGSAMEGLDERPPVYMVKQASTTGKRSASWLGRRTGSSLGGHRRAASAAKADDLGAGGAGDLVIVNNCKGAFGLTDLMKAAAEVIGSGGLGSAYKAVMANGVAVVVKRARDMNRATKDAFEAEMKRLGAVRHANLLPPLAYHYRKDEKLLVYEYIPKGSLLYVLHGDRGVDYAALDWPMRLKVAVGVARGTAFLHTALAGHEVPHGNLKSANILLAPDFEPLLVDFGYSGLINHTQSANSMIAHRAPECVAGHLVGAKADVYCLGVVLLEILTGKFPSQYLHNAKGGTDLVMWATSAIADGYERDLFDPAMMAAWKFALPDMTRLMHVAVDCVEMDVDKRPDMKQAAARVEEVVAGAMATVRERQQAAGERPGDAAGSSRSSHAQYVRDGSMQRITSVGERSSRRGSNDYSYGIS
ncbi:pollen receptor-like kinase 3 [Oryza brachyantha]|uniref:pollen receptor-like kinase 3 n=1 Tax=Oryza brachyantha TaxID=4533 RepID=UPI001ADB6DFF|nr:pollen receptor-like kinase 3 [Oryza brachyantha]